MGTLVADTLQAYVPPISRAHARTPTCTGATRICRPDCRSAHPHARPPGPGLPVIIMPCICIPKVYRK